MDEPQIREKFETIPEGPYDGTKGLNMFSKEVLRRNLSENLKEIKKKTDAKEMVRKITIYRDIDEKYFSNKSALHFC